MTPGYYGISDRLESITLSNGLNYGCNSDRWNIQPTAMSGNSVTEISSIDSDCRENATIDGF